MMFLSNFFQTPCVLRENTFLHRVHLQKRIHKWMKLKTDETANPESEARAGIKPVDFNFGVIFGAVVFFF